MCQLESPGDTLGGLYRSLDCLPANMCSHTIPSDESPPSTWPVDFLLRTHFHHEVASRQPGPASVISARATRGRCRRRPIPDAQALRRVRGNERSRSSPGSGFHVTPHDVAAAEYPRPGPEGENT